MKKLAVVVMMIAIATFMAAPMASAWDDHWGGIQGKNENDHQAKPSYRAEDHHWGAIQGTYSMTATGSCLHSTLGFNANLTPITGSTASVVWGASVTPQAIWTFESDGTGTVLGTNYILDFPPGSLFFGGPIARQSPISFNFHYEVAHDGAITVYPPSPPNLVGMISKDHKTLQLSNANQVQPVGPLGYAICNIARVLIRVEEADD